MALHTRLFTQVDHTEDRDFFVRFMDEAQKPPGIQAGTLQIGFTAFVVVGAPR